MYTSISIEVLKLYIFFKIQKKYAKFYVVIMNEIMKNDEDYIQSQQSRMNNLLKGKLSKNKIDELTKKINIISSFKYRKDFKDEL